MNDAAKLWRISRTHVHFMPPLSHFYPSSIVYPLQSCWSTHHPSSIASSIVLLPFHSPDHPCLLPITFIAPSYPFWSSSISCIHPSVIHPLDLPSNSINSIHPFPPSSPSHPSCIMHHDSTPVPPIPPIHPTSVHHHLIFPIHPSPSIAIIHPPASIHQPSAISHHPSILSASHQLHPSILSASNQLLPLLKSPPHHPIQSLTLPSNSIDNSASNALYLAKPDAQARGREQARFFTAGA